MSKLATLLLCRLLSLHDRMYWVWLAAEGCSMQLGLTKLTGLLNNNRKAVLAT